ncbi:MAG: DinB family protein [Deltaproteobacteria bacterium]|nr:DinB family protein [Deltaproteobacteria bacterium]
MLSSWGVAFEAVNVAGNPVALAELKRLGAPLVPAVTVGERIVHGWNPRGFAELLGISYSEEPRLSPTELAERLDRVLQATQRVLRQVPTGRLDARIPGGERTIRDLSYHIFRLSLVFRDAAIEDRFPEAWLLEKVPTELNTGEEIARYGALVRERLGEWFTGHPEEPFLRPVQTYYGPQSLHALLERTAWHAAQHFRQVCALLEGIGITPDQPLTAEDYAGLPLPATVW